MTLRSENNPWTAGSIRQDFNRITGYSGSLCVDLALFHGAPIDRTRPIPHEHRGLIDLHLVDITFAGESRGNMSDSCQSKITKYSPLVKALENLGYKSVSFTPLVAGVRGWHPQMCTSALARLSIRTQRSKALTYSFSRTAWRFIRAITGTRRRLEVSPQFRARSGMFQYKLHRAAAKAFQAG